MNEVIRHHVKTIDIVEGLDPKSIVLSAALQGKQLTYEDSACVITRNMQVITAFPKPPGIVQISAYAKEMEKRSKFTYYCYPIETIISKASAKGLSLEGSLAYLYRFPSLFETRLIINAGVSKIVYYKESMVNDTSEKSISLELLREAQLFLEKETFN